MNLISEYNKFISFDNNVNTSVFVLGCIAGFTFNNLHYIEKHPFLSTLDVIIHGSLYVCCNNILKLFSTSSQKIILPVLVISVAILLYKNKLSSYINKLIT